MTFGLSNALTFNLIVTTMGLICFWSCTPDQPVSHSTEDYYLNHLTFAGKGIVYRYAAVADRSLPDELWHFRFDGHHRGNFLRATMYTPSGEVAQRSVERLSRESAELRSLDLIFRDERGYQEIATTIVGSRTFIFGPVDSVTQSVYTIAYWDTTEDSVRVVLRKERMLEGPVEFVFDGNKIPAIKVLTNERLETETVGFTETEWTGIEIFAQGYGLVYYKKTISETFVLEYSLVEILDYGTFQSRYLVQETQ